MDLTPSQRRTVRTWFTGVHERDERFAFPIQFTRMVAGDKPATILQQSDWTVSGSPFDSIEDVLAFIDDLGLAAFQRRNRRGPSRTHIIGRSHARLDLLPSSMHSPSNDAWHRRHGVVFGYPRADIEWFIRDEDRTPPGDRIENGEFHPEDMAYIDFLPYRNEDSIEGYERAIEEGRRIKDLLATVSGEWELPIIHSIADEHYQLSVAVYSGERDHFPGEYTGFKMVCKNPALD